MPALAAPDIRWMASFVEALREGHARDGLRPETPDSIAAVASDPAAYLESLRNAPATLILPDGRRGPTVPSTALWWVEDDRFLGAVHIRHELNDNLEKVGGHLGYAVRPSARSQGHATAMLAAGLDWVRENLPLKRVLLTVNPKNPHSVRVIEKNGGVYAETVPHIWRAGEVERRYWIEL